MVCHRYSPNERCPDGARGRPTGGTPDSPDISDRPDMNDKTMAGMAALTGAGSGRDNRREDGRKRLAPQDGFEPPAKRLTVACSTADYL